jgi:hypothetical protein
MIKPIETAYKGYRFRSRLEARWAVFFDSLNIIWEYEKEGYDLGDLGWYLPDFWLPTQRLWVEIKNDIPTDDEMKKLFKVAEETEARQAVILWSEDPFKIINWSAESQGWYQVYPVWDNYYMWCECPICKYIGIEFEGRAPRLSCSCLDGDKEPRTFNSVKIKEAYVAARQARFEHGQFGLP